MKQKFLSVFLTLVMAAAVPPKMELKVNAACEEVIMDRIVFGLNEETNMATVTGVSGGLQERLIIPEKVVDRDGVEYVVNSIGKEAFAHSKTLEEVEIPDSVTEIGQEAFCWSRIKKIKLPDSVETIGEKAFSWCEKLTTAELPNNPKCNCIEEGVFEECRSLKNITIPGNITKIGERAFEGSGLEAIVFPDSVESMGEKAFWGCENLTTVSLSNNPKCNCIKEKVFEYCKSLKKITLPDNIEAIEKRAFVASGLETIVFPDSVKTIDKEAFSYCKNLTTVSLSNNTKFNCIEEEVFLDCEKLGELTIPGNVTKIGRGAFKRSGLKTIVFPDGVEIIDKEAFKSCKNLTTVKLPNNPKYNCIGKEVFLECEKLSELTIPSNITKIDENSFSGSGLKTIVFPDSVETIGKGAFWCCENLTTVIWPNDPKFNCIEGCVFAGCTMLRGITIPGNVTEIGEGTFSGSGLETIVLHDGVETIGEEAFEGCEKLTTVKLPNNPKCNCIKKGVFDNCTSLKKITIPDNIKVIEREAFSYSGLKTIVLPDGVAFINEEAFKSCKNLTTVKLPSSLVYISNSAFLWSDNLRIVKIPVSLKKVEVDAPKGRKKVSVGKLLQIIYAVAKGKPLKTGAKLNPDDKVIEFDLDSIFRISGGGIFGVPNLDLNSGSDSGLDSDSDSDSGSDSGSDSDPDSDSGSDSDLDSDSDSGSDSGSDSDSDSDPGSDSGSDSDSDSGSDSGSDSDSDSDLN